MFNRIINYIKNKFFSKFNKVNFNEKESQLYPVIVIRTDGIATIASIQKGNKTVCQAMAKRNEIEEFNYNAGAKVALKRVMEQYEKKIKYKK